MLRGSKKTSLLLFGGPSRVEFLLTDVLIQSLVAYNLQADNVALAWMILLAWEFCLIAGLRSLSWKSWRVGKATQLAKDGRNIGQILLAGEWKSASYDQYVDTDLIDPSALLQVALDQSDDEAD